jgi:HEAT repeat protein
MRRDRPFGLGIRGFIIGSVLVLLAGRATESAQPPQQKAWEILQAGTKSTHLAERTIAVNVLGLIRNNRRAARFAEIALADPKPAVRAAAAAALGEMGSRASIPKLEDALHDEETSVVLAAAHSLLTLKDPAAYEVYYAILTGGRKSGKGLLADQEKMLKDPKRMALFGFEQGIGLIPFAGIGWDVVRTIAKDDVSPVRAAAAKNLAADPDPHSGQALALAVVDKSWVVRVAALNAIARRDDPALLDDAVPAMFDEKPAVRYTAAAAVVRLSATAERHKAMNK